MKPTYLHRRPLLLNGQHGYSLIEVLVAVMIAIFLLGGLFSILQSTRKTSTDQTLLAQLQDNERIAMTLVAETIQTAGYYPNPQTQSAANAFPSTTAFSQATQVVTGTYGPDTKYPNAIGDSITVRYQSDGSGGVLGCLGTSDTTGVAHEYELFIQYDDATRTTSSLYCSVDGKTPQALVPNVSGMKVVYGVDTTGSGTGINAYIPGPTDTSLGNMTNADWLNVYSVSVQLTFPNPLLNVTGQSNTGQTNAPPITFTRIIGLMARTGTNSATFNN